MHVLIVILGFLGTAAVWWYRVKYMRQAAADMANAAGKVRSKMQREGRTRKSALLPITAIDDPVHAAATMIAAIATEDGAMTPQIEARLKTAIGEIASTEKTDEAITYAKWASQEVTDVPLIVDRLARFLETKLNGTEKVHLIELVQDVAGADVPPARFIDRLRQLRRKLGLVVN